MSEKNIFRTIVVLIALVGATFMGGDQITTNYLIGCVAIIFATLLLYIVEFSNDNN